MDSVQLNEACSSGCGSFIETFAKSLNYSVQSFAKAAFNTRIRWISERDVPVFMNSNVKQAQKRGRFRCGISPPASPTLLSRMPCLRSSKSLPPATSERTSLYRGGTFYNDAVLRASSGSPAAMPSARISQVSWVPSARH